MVNSLPLVLPSASAAHLEVQDKIKPLTYSFTTGASFRLCLLYASVGF